jgi:hypothetical protein
VGAAGTAVPVANVVDHRRDSVYLVPITRSRVGRIAWSLLRLPIKNREFPARHERLVTPDELMRFGF